MLGAPLTGSEPSQPYRRADSTTRRAPPPPAISLPCQRTIQPAPAPPNDWRQPPAVFATPTHFQYSPTSKNAPAFPPPTGGSAARGVGRLTCSTAKRKPLRPEDDVISPLTEASLAKNTRPIWCSDGQPRAQAKTPPANGEPPTVATTTVSALPHREHAPLCHVCQWMHARNKERRPVSKQPLCLPRPRQAKRRRRKHSTARRPHRWRCPRQEKTSLRRRNTPSGNANATEL